MVRFTIQAIRAALLTAAVAILAANCSAAQGTFTLPFETHWDYAVLAPGEYTVSTSDDATWPKVLTVSGNGKTVYILASVDKIIENTEGSYLTIDDIGGVKVVRELQSSALGKSFHFFVPKTLHNQMADSRTPQNRTKVAVRTRS